MDEAHEKLSGAEPGDPPQVADIHMPITPSDDGKAVRVDDPAVKRLIPKLNREQAAVIRLLKGSLRSMLRTGAVLAEAEGILGCAFPHWVQTKLPLTTTEAAFLVRLCQAKSGINEKDLSPTQEVKLTRLVELLEEFFGSWHKGDVADKPLLEIERSTQLAH
jgi:hypothetical protein